MLHVKDLPDAEILKKFAERYPDANVDQILQFLTFLRVASDLSNGLDQFLAKHQLLQGRWWVLILLMREDDLISTPSKLAKQAGVSRATMTGLLNGLQRDELVTRLTANNDRRQSRVKLTEKGQGKLDEVMPDYYQRLNHLMSVLTETEGENFMDALLQLKNQRQVFE
ncbi:MarR family winged helix-turn-helix transcriptional regulator [Methylophaga sp.]|uniref:MarR family winged helix-turn-helix transcriptional regulator n=1 Tax=Methylophaga sp. TaxID=2024840 RepID=UPI003F6A40B8